MQMGQSELGQVWFNSSITYVWYKSFSMVEAGQRMVSIMFPFFMFKDCAENAEIECICMDYIRP